ncbi:Uncharacterised protein [Bordetella pertussis]|nr:Uncharacterised protein [Bordetella pertussis]
MLLSVGTCCRIAPVSGTLSGVTAWRGGGSFWLLGK